MNTTGGSSYIDRIALRERDMTNGWTGAIDGGLDVACSVSNLTPPAVKLDLSGFPANGLRSPQRQRRAVATVIAQLLLCGACSDSVSVPPVPEVPMHLAPDDSIGLLSAYLTDFALSQDRNEELPVAERRHPRLPVGFDHLNDHLASVDHDSGSGFWLIQAYRGSNWMQKQTLYLYEPQHGTYRNVRDLFPGTTLDDAILIMPANGNLPLIIGALSPGPGTAPRASEIWVADPLAGSARRLAFGWWPKTSPDRRMLAFWQSDDTGFHCLSVCEATTLRPNPVLSMQESDPGAGMSWRWGWTKDSKAIAIAGTCSGFVRSESRPQLANFVFRVSDNALMRIN